MFISLNAMLELMENILYFWTAFRVAVMWPKATLESISKEPS